MQSIFGSFASPTWWTDLLLTSDSDRQEQRKPLVPAVFILDIYKQPGQVWLGPHLLLVSHLMEESFYGVLYVFKNDILKKTKSGSMYHVLDLNYICKCKLRHFYFTVMSSWITVTDKKTVKANELLSYLTD